MSTDLGRWDKVRSVALSVPEVKVAGMNSLLLH